MNLCYHRVLHTFSSGRCVYCAEPTRTKLFDNAHAFICSYCLERIHSIPQHISYEHTPYSTIFFYGIYEGALQDIIPAYKYDAKFYYAPLLADMLFFTIQSCCIGQYDICIPIPQHDSKMRKRGFYHLGLLTHYLTQHISFPIEHGYVQAMVNYTSQQALSREERLHNVHNVFHVCKPCVYSRILLLDDVITTGATIYALAELLRSSGAKHIDCLALAVNKRGIHQ